MFILLTPLACNTVHICRWSMLWRILLAILAAGFAYTAFFTFYDLI